MQKEGQAFLKDFLATVFVFVKPLLGKMEIDEDRLEGSQEMTAEEKLILLTANETRLKDACFHILTTLTNLTENIPETIKRLFTIIRNELRFFQRKSETKESFLISLNDLSNPIGEFSSLFELYKVVISKGDLSDIKETEANLSLKVISTIMFLRFILPCKNYP